jgi:branched-chain amino acid transport system substrate-binding protein
MRHFAKWTLAAVASVTLATGASEANAACEELALGAAISLTGKYSSNGIHAQKGYDFAAKKINDAGGVKVGDKCYNLKVVYYDDESTPARGAQLAERLINQDKVRFMLGPYSSGMTKAIVPVTEKYQIPMVQGQGASRSLFNKGYKYMFAVLSTSEQYLASTIDLAAELAKKAGKDPSEVKIAMAFENDPFSLDVRAGVIDDAKKYNMKVVLDDKLPRDLSDMSATLTKVKALKPDMLLVSGHSKGAATAARQVGEMQIDTPIIAVTHCEAADITGQFPDASEGMLCPTQWAETLTYKDPMFGSASDYDKEIKSTIDHYKDREVPYQTAQATASVYVFYDALQRAGSLEKEAVRKALAETDMMTFYGPVKFSDAGNNIAKPMVLRQIQDGKYNVVAPSKFASHKLEYPRKPN